MGSINLQSVAANRTGSHDKYIVNLGRSPIKLKKVTRKGILMKKNNKEIKIKISIPDFLPEDKREEFIDLTEKLIARNLLNEMDRQAYNLLWFFYLMCLEAMGKIKEIGLVQKDRHIVIKNPAIQILRDASSQFYKFAGQFGLMPSARRNSLYLDLEIPSDHRRRPNFLNEEND